MNPFASLCATFIAWYHNPARILGQFDRVQRRLAAAVAHHNEQATAKTAAVQALQAQVDDHTAAADRAASVSVKLAALVN